MTQAEKLEVALQRSEEAQMDQAFPVEVIDSKTGLVEETIALPAGTYYLYSNLDLLNTNRLRKFVEDPNCSMNRLLRLPERS